MRFPSRHIGGDVIVRIGLPEGRHEIVNEHNTRGGGPYERLLGWAVRCYLRAEVIEHDFESNSNLSYKALKELLIKGPEFSDVYYQVVTNED